MRSRLVRVLCILLSSLSVVSCTALWQDLTGASTRQGISSSLVDYLYPKGEIPPEFDQVVPNLRLPVKVGLAFVPSHFNSVEGLSEADKNLLLTEVKVSFTERDFIGEIIIIPDTYLRSGKGFQNVDQLARLYSLDVMALVSYDQVAHADDTKASILYWTVVGAYFIKGSKNDVQTFVDTAIFDVNTHKLLFRAPGINTIEGTSTLINSAEQMRLSRKKSFSLAMEDMSKNLEQELDAFKERIKQDKSVTITHRAGYGGGGAFGFYTLLMLLSLFALKRYQITKNVA